MNGRMLLLAGVSVLALAGTATAADYARAPAYAPPPMVGYNWTGFYAGLYSGAATTHFDNAVDYSGSDDSTATSVTGVIGGGQLGYNIQAGSIVYGIVGDLTWLGDHVNQPGSEDDDYAYFHNLDWLGTIRGKVGVAEGDWLFYGTAGAAVAKVNFGVVDTYSTTETKWGWVAGAGLEKAITPHMTVFAEGLYADLGHADFASGSYTESLHHTIMMAKVGVNMKW